MPVSLILTSVFLAANIRAGSITAGWLAAPGHERTKVAIVEGRLPLAIGNMPTVYVAIVRANPSTTRKE